MLTALAILLLVTPKAAALDPGRDGSLVVTAPDTIVNQYANLSTNASAGATDVRVSNITTNLPGLVVGDLVMIYQAQGASITTDNNYTFGAISNLNSAGRYEFHIVTSITTSNGRIRFQNACSGLRNSYTTAGGAQVIRVPQYENLTIQSGASIVPLAWNGSRGGVVALHVAGTLTVNGTIDASGRGFRGGAWTNTTAPNGITAYRLTDNNEGGRKGESIAGSSYPSSYNFGRGAAANGGGGGNSHNAGGGGGANGNSGNPWNIGTVNGGQGIPDVGLSFEYLNAWGLDPTAAQAGFDWINYSGGGRGGYSWSDGNADELTIGPGNSDWLGDDRREVGGLGGRPLDNDPNGRLFLGGGGGAGHGNNNVGGSGGNGGGLVYILAPAITGTGTILSNGANGGGAGTGNPNDAPGGAGAGGTLILHCNTITAGVTASANGGRGGIQPYEPIHPEAEGPGGGGGGGYIAVSGGAITQNANGGLGGITTSLSMPNFPYNGATGGAPGQTNQNITTIPICETLVTGHVFYDLDGNGRKDPGEFPIPNITVAITNSANQIVNVTTDLSGNFRTVVPAGATTLNVDENDSDLQSGSFLTTRNDTQALGSVYGIATGSTPFGFSADPLLVNLQYFNAIADFPGQRVILRWSTSAEFDNAGFNIYEANPVAARNFTLGTRLNTNVIPAAGSETEGADYSFEDPRPLTAGEERWYYLEDIEFGGKKTLHGPIQAGFKTAPLTTVEDWQDF
jgi:hypothetical protein